MSFFFEWLTHERILYSDLRFATIASKTVDATFYLPYHKEQATWIEGEPPQYRPQT